ncbi:methyltransferase domain-containing protein [Fragilaria crotonensis]|nr:methyltransferase domain-containing protein [Fragilaria crotonensis]KAI2498621.1 methyltransferase domain-containing protein [Fragilaria crotonensis]
MVQWIAPILQFVPHGTPPLFVDAALSINTPNPNSPKDKNEISRRQVVDVVASNGWKVAGLLGVVASGAAGYDAMAVGKEEDDDGGGVGTGSSRFNFYPEDHTRRVARTIRDAFHGAVSTTNVMANANADAALTPFRVLEVGMGQDCRLIRTGLYKDAFDTLATMGVTKIELVGMDLIRPTEKSIQTAKDYLKQQQQDSPLQVDLTVLKGDIMQLPSFLPAETLPFDAIISCLTLCSVKEPDLAVASIRDSLRPRGGCLGYVEHVAVDPSEPYKFLEWQQEKLDPLQQALADNCHLHRYTEQTIAQVFGIDQHRAELISEERFLVNSMWPVSCQACGVVQRTVPS